MPTATSEPTRLPVRFFLLLSLVLAAPAAAQTWDAMRDIVPRGYVAYRASTPLVIDGKTDERAWLDAPQTELFVDIEGEDHPRPRYATRARMLWDDDFLYVSAHLAEPHVWGDSTERNTVVFYDNDFEVFLDPDGDNHGYYEFEMNALNTIWELTLEKPYKDGGPARDPTNLPGLRSAVFVDGTLNAAHDEDRGWSVEIAFPWKALASYNPGRATPPAPGDYWRVGFSRVEWQHEITPGGDYRKIPGLREANWVWSPQGIIDMHRPERWGFVLFTDAPPGTASFTPDPTLPARDLLMAIYHAQKSYHAAHERWAATLDALGLAPADLRTETARITGFTSSETGYVVTAVVRLPDGSEKTLYTNERSRIWSE